jgi:hypothetical protein
MRASIAAQGFTALATTHDDDSMTLALIDANGHTIAVGQFDAPEEQSAQQYEAEDVQWPRRAS